ncbi:YobI family P-loop NTPase [Oerskovia enterophila]|uniref:YobI family P-loop NTPase n=1 Tax=Oerskovia enterophila TaxID=43678 RepID=UPI00339A9053
MPGNTLPQPRGFNLRPGQRLHVETLAPRFQPERHQLYFDLLERALDAKDVRNIALTGAYGTGKSSVLEHLDTTRQTRVVKLSLSTIAPEAHDRDDSTGGGEAGDGHSRTNQIQKEIVKQLLYRLPPKDVPHSRFRRATALNKDRDLKIAAVVGGVAFVVLFGLGLLQPWVEQLLPAVWRQVIAYVLLLGLAMVAAWAVLRVVRARPTLSASVQTGAATVTLSKQSDSYFDEYLDEIVYFFQASGRDIVVIEDIDRFEDVQVFDTLRALNGLLNSSEQIARRIVFVYAIRDSVFEQIGAKARSRGEAPSSEGSDRAKATLKRASRTKFFDVIIPVVPFVSADNARDVMTEVMASPDFEINPALIRLAARHVADMRMIRNIRNEFEVYRNRLVLPDDRIPGIDDDLVFAIVLYKNTHLADFEKIRHRESALDGLYKAWRALVRENLAAEAATLSEHRRDRHLSATADARAAHLGERLTAFTNTLLASARVTTSSSTTAELNGPATEDNLNETGTWSTIAAGTPQQIVLHNPRPRYSPSFTLSFTAGQLSELLSVTISEHEWDTQDLDELASKIAHQEARLTFLRHHDWAALCKQADLMVEVTPLKLSRPSGESFEGRVSFSAIVDATLPSELARDLVRHGYLTSHFALYTSTYYGNHLGRDAIEYIRRCIEPGEPDATFTLSEDDVEQILREQGATTDDADLFSDPSIYNVSILDHLLTHRPGSAATVVRNLSGLRTQDKGFLDTYIQHGAHPGSLLAAMAQHWRGVLPYAAADSPMDPAVRTVVLDAVLRALPHSKYEVDSHAAHVLASDYRDIDVILNPDSPAQAEIVYEVIRASGAQLESLAPLNPSALAAALKFQVYPVSKENLRVLLPDGPISLDSLRATSVDAYRYVLASLPGYLDLVDGATDVSTVQSPDEFISILNEVAKSADASLVARFISCSSAECRVPDLQEVAPVTWPTLAAERRTDPTFTNAAEYVAHHGVDQHISHLLTKTKKITVADGNTLDERRQLAVELLNATDHIPSAITRVSLAASLDPGHLAAPNLKPESSDLVARLLRKGLLSDDVSTFSAGILVEWPAHEAAIVASKLYPSFVAPEILPVVTIPQFFRSAKVTTETKRAVLKDLAGFLIDASVQRTRSVAASLIGWKLSYPTIEVLRAAGAEPGQIVRLAHARGDGLTTEQLKQLLRSIGGDFERVADGGRGRPTFPVTPSHRWVLDRLVDDTIREVEEKDLKGKGPRLVAHLTSRRSG